LNLTDTKSHLTWFSSLHVYEQMKMIKSNRHNIKLRHQTPTQRI